MLLLEDKILPMVSTFHSVFWIGCLWFIKTNRWNQRIIYISTDITSVIFRWIICFIFVNGTQDFFSGSKDSLSRDVISYKSNCNTVAVLLWKLQSCLQKDCCHPNYLFLKKENFDKGAIKRSVPRLVLN